MAEQWKYMTKVQLPSGRMAVVVCSCARDDTVVVQLVDKNGNYGTVMTVKKASLTRV